MKIISFKYFDRENNWKLEHVNFSNLNLLVGISGVGKTKILRSLFTLKLVASGYSFSGPEWEINFLINNKKYCWKGAYEKYQKDKDIIFEMHKFYKIEFEELYIDDKLVIKRKGLDTYFNEQKLPKLSHSSSTIFTLKEEEVIRDVFYHFSERLISENNIGLNLFSIIDNEYRNFSETPLLWERNRTDFNIYSLTEQEHKFYLSENLSSEKIINSNFPIFFKLALSFKHFPEMFERIKYAYKDIFPQVIDIKIEPEKKEFIFENIEKPGNAKIVDLVIKIKERGVKNWIHQSEISAGMLTTLKRICDIYLLPSGTVMLIDEFENSLGINCINIVREESLEEPKIQFIITSHHPYIINNIDMEFWKIVTRQGSIVTVKDTQSLELSKSKHENFIQLMNLEEYREGIKV